MDADFIVETFIYIYFFRDNKHVCVHKKYNEYHGYVSSNPNFTFRENKIILMKMHNLPDSLLVRNNLWETEHYKIKYGTFVKLICVECNININSIYKICKKTVVYSINRRAFIGSSLKMSQFPPTAPGTPPTNDFPLIKKVASFPPPTHAPPPSPRQQLQSHQIKIKPPRKRIIDYLFGCRYICSVICLLRMNETHPYPYHTPTSTHSRITH